MKKQLAIMSLAIAAIVVLAAGTAFAANTPSGTLIDNYAQIYYEVGGVGQTLINTPTISFVVDNKVQPVVSWSGTYTSVVPGALKQAIKFTVANSGNTVQDLGLTAIANANSFTPVIYGIYNDTNNNGTYDDGVDVAISYIDELAIGLSNSIFVVANIPASATNGQIGSVILTATTRNGGGAGAQGAVTANTPGADTPGSVDVVYADAIGDAAGDIAQDGKHSKGGVFSVTASVLALAKRSWVNSAPFDNANPKAIPGATVKYEIKVSNSAGGATAQNIKVTDDINAEVTSGWIAYGAGSIVVNAPNFAPATNKSMTDAVADADGGFYNGATNEIVVNGITLTGGQDAYVTFTVVIQ